MNLNIGASEVKGIYRDSSWINLDINKNKGVNVVGSGLVLPFKNNSIDLIHCVHVLEHVTRDKNERMLAEMFRVLKPGAETYIEVPNFKKIVYLLAEAFRTNNIKIIHNLTTSIYGKNERLGMAHYWGFTKEKLTEKMVKMGFKKAGSIVGNENMISGHYRQEPVLLMRGVK
jgi:predicted SAM-dependent methyltransferase